MKLPEIVLGWGRGIYSLQQILQIAECCSKKKKIKNFQMKTLLQTFATKLLVNQFSTS